MALIILEVKENLANDVVRLIDGIEYEIRPRFFNGHDVLVNQETFEGHEILHISYDQFGNMEKIYIEKQG